MYDDTFTQSFFAIMRRRLKEHKEKFPMQTTRLRAEILAANAAYLSASTDDERDRAVERENLAIAALVCIRPTQLARTTR
jgi:hypothetical protein